MSEVEGGLTIPEEAIHAAAGEIEYYGVDKHEREVAAREALEAAAPLIVAEAFEAVAREYWSEAHISKVLRKRAAELRGVSGVSADGGEKTDG